MTTLVILTALSLVCLFSEIFGFKKVLHILVLAGLTAALSAAVLDWNTDKVYFNDMVRMDNYSLAFTGLIISLSILWFIMSPRFFDEPSSKTDHYALILFSIIGVQLMASFSNMLILFLGIEILSICMYVLAGSRKSDLNSNEASLKYLLLGAFATGFLLFGITLIYGVTGSFQVSKIAEYFGQSGSSSPLAFAGILLMFTAMAFKVSAVPFHFWAPDVYQGSPTVITAFMSTVVKTAAFAALFRLFHVSFESISESWSTMVWIISAATILLGNITAVYQKNFKRMLAYSSISHAGYMLMAVLALTPSSSSSLLFYATAYSISSICSFAVLLAISRSGGNESIAAFRGMAKTNPFLATVTVVAMLSLAGIPPLAGFFAKYYIFSSAIQAGYTNLVLIAILGSLIGVFYYFRIIIALFEKESETTSIPLNFSFQAILLLTAVAALILGIAPGLLTDLI
ncbi:MAG: NADH-quinone oxidoreductase subunit N [Bacteroidia bacterium]|nr:NADH-quinone oxidoreductase subunit N [Bacteroidia bacterium]